ncbi:CRISPR-associated endonuclease Cas2 [Caminibacter sp.]
MKFLITYDIRNRKRWYRVFKILKEKGLNVQLSCFEVDINEKEMEDLLFEIQKIIDWQEDSVYCFPISKYAVGMTTKLGKNEDINESVVL